MSAEKKIPLVEMFGPTIQGEGAVIGQQTYFMRFGLCDYSCKMCDSMNAVDPKQVKANAKWLTQEEIVNEFAEKTWLSNSTRWITLSGGNPCIHDLSALVNSLKGAGHKIAVETQGTKAPSWLSMVDVITVSPKGPGMGEKTSLVELDAFMRYVMSANPTAVNIKIVLFDQRDIEFTSMIWERYGQTGVPFYLSLGNMFPPIISGSTQRDPYSDGSVSISREHHMSTLIGEYKQLFEDIKTHPQLSQMRFLPQWHVFVWGNQKGK